MKKLFSLCLAVLSACTLSAQTTLFSMEVKASGSDFKAGTTETEATTSNYLASISGGTLHVAITDGSEQKVFGSDNSEYHLRLASGKAYAKFTLSGTTLAAGDTIKFTGSGDAQPYITITKASSSSIAFSAKKYIIPENSSLVGKNVFYLWKPSSNAFIKTLSIIRPSTASYTITYDANGGSGEMENSTNTVSANGFTYEGKDFVEWNTQADGEGTSYAPGAKASSDLNLFAIWQDHVAKYTLVYKVDGDSVNSEIVTVGGTPAGIAAPTKDCYTFAGWDPALDAVSGTDGATVYVNATWTPIYAQSFNFGATTDLTKDNIKSKLDAVGIACKVGTGGSYDNGSTAGYLGYKFKNNGDYVAFLVEDGYKATVTYGYTQSGWKVNGVDAGVATAQGVYVEKEYIADGSDQLFKLVNQSADTKTSVLTKIVIEENIPSDDATIKSLTVNGEAVEAVEDVYSYIVGSTSEATKVAVVFVLNDAKASADKESGFEIDVPEAGAAANTATITVTAEDETQKVYTVSVTKATAASDDATLKALSVDGFTLTPAFDPAVVEYTITKAYEAALPAVSKVTATSNDANAQVTVSYDAVILNQINILVEAEDGETKASYTITVNNAPAIKSLKEVLFSNGFNAFIDNTNRTVKAFYLSGSEAPTAITITAGTNCTASEIVENVITVTGADESEVDYTVTLEAVTPNTTTVAESAAAGAFDGTEAWVKNGLLVYGNSAGWVANDKYYVLRRQIKNGDAADDQRVIAGWVRTYFFVGNASKLQLTIANNNKVKYSIDGGTPVASESNTLVIPLESGNHMIEIVTNQNGGDCRISAPKLVERPYDPTALYNTEAGVKAVKKIVNGQLVIEKNGQVFNVMGQTIR